jgi:hypothetical protein
MLKKDITKQATTATKKEKKLSKCTTHSLTHSLTAGNEQKCDIRVKRS